MNQLTVFAIATMVGAVAMMVFTALRLLAQRPRADEHIGWVSIALRSRGAALLPGADNWPRFD